jgi:hypothetical protein
MKVLLFAAISLILSNLSYSESKYSYYTKAIREREEGINNFDFSRYNPLVEKQIKEDFNNFKAEMEKARSEDPEVKAEIAANRADRDKEKAMIERWSKKIPQTIKSKRRVIEVE